MPYLTCRLQSGSDRILKAMNRKHTAESYIRLIRAHPPRPRPDLVLSERFLSSVFPVETEADFQATPRSGAEVGYGKPYPSRYSAPSRHAPLPTRGRRSPMARMTWLHRFAGVVDHAQRATQVGMVGRRV